MSYDPTRAAATRAAVLRTLADTVRDADQATRAELLAALEVGDRINGRLPDGTLAGRVVIAEGPVTVVVEDARAFLAHVEATAPGEVQTVQIVRPAYITKLLEQVKTTGELLPGVGLRTGDPRPVVTVPRADRAAIRAAWADGTLRLADVIRPALPAGDEAA